MNNVIEVPSSIDVGEWEGWLLETAVSHKLTFENNPLILLIHTSEGIIWGKLDADGLNLSGDQFSKWQGSIKSKLPHLNIVLESKTLHQLRLFNLSGELFIWRDQDKFKYVVKGADDSQVETNDSQHLLWGTDILGSFADFNLLQEGERGLWHTPPALGATEQSARLRIRHYIEYDDMNQAYLSGTRLLELEWYRSGGN